MGHTKGPYREEFPVGTRVRIRSAEVLSNFAQTWTLHHPLSPEQVGFAGHTSVVTGVSFYHGGAELYRLADAPGVWHETLLEKA